MYVYELNFHTVEKEVSQVEQDRLDQFMTLVVSASRSVTKLKSRYMNEYGLGSTHTMCIRSLYTSGDGLTRTKLADVCELDKAQVSRIVNELSEKGYVTEGPGATNYKRKVRLSEKGMQIAEDINSIVLRINQFVSGDLTQDEIFAFYDVFGKICDKLKQAEENSEKDI